MSILIKNGIIFYEGNFVEGSIRIEGKEIIDVGKGPSLEEEAEEVIDARGCLILPGLIDLRSKFPFPFRKKVDLRSLTRRKAMGGFTTIIIDPQPTSLNNFDWISFLSEISNVDGPLLSNIAFLTHLSFKRSDRLSSFSIGDSLTLSLWSYCKLRTFDKELAKDEKRPLLFYFPSLSCDQEERLSLPISQESIVSQKSMLHKFLSKNKSVILPNIITPKLLKEFSSVSKQGRVLIASPLSWLSFSNIFAEKISASSSKVKFEFNLGDSDDLRTMIQNLLDKKIDLTYPGEISYILDEEIYEVDTSPLFLPAYFAIIKKYSTDLSLIPLNSKRIANEFKLFDRSEIQLGYKADLVLFDYKRPTPKAFIENFGLEYSQRIQENLYGEVIMTINNGKISYDSESGYSSYSSGVIIKSERSVHSR
ncbi:MAG: hypothetical protein QW314_06620 [Thermoproteota archaeon]|nr:hypothetical protein [Candidatus Brockarchaeota archaeon]